MSAKTVSEEAAQTASPRQWIRLVVVYLLFPLVLFICGGDLGWWQAWLYSILIFASGIGGRLWAEKRHPGLTAERQNFENIQTGRPDFTGRVVGLSRLFPTRALSVDSRDILRDIMVGVPEQSLSSDRESCTPPDIRIERKKSRG